eukprot:scaffold68_cov340-Pavlova_lutheri.AAC.27
MKLCTREFLGTLRAALPRSQTVDYPARQLLQHFRSSPPALPKRRGVEHGAVEFVNLAGRAPWPSAPPLPCLLADSTSCAVYASSTAQACHRKAFPDVRLTPFEKQARAASTLALLRSHMPHCNHTRGSWGERSELARKSSLVRSS